MDGKRFVLSDLIWERLAPLLPGKATDSGVTVSDNCLFLEAVFCRFRTGSPWRDLPEALGTWNSQLRRFRCWTECGVSGRLFRALTGDTDLEYTLIDGSIVSVHQKVPGAKGEHRLRPFTARQCMFTCMRGRAGAAGWGRWWTYLATLCGSCYCRGRPTI